MAAIPQPYGPQLTKEGIPPKALQIPPLEPLET